MDLGLFCIFYGNFHFHKGVNTTLNNLKVTRTLLLKFALYTRQKHRSIFGVNSEITFRYSVG